MLETKLETEETSILHILLFAHWILTVLLKAESVSEISNHDAVQDATAGE